MGKEERDDVEGGAEEEEEVEHDVMGWSKSEKDREGMQEKNILTEGVTMGLARNMALETLPGIHKNDPR